MFLKVIWIFICFKISYDQKCENCDNLGLQIKVLVTIKHFLLNIFGGVKMCDKMAISAYSLKIVEKDPFLRLQMRAKEMFTRHQFLFHK